MHSAALQMVAYNPPDRLPCPPNASQSLNQQYDPEKLSHISNPQWYSNDTSSTLNESTDSQIEGNKFPLPDERGNQTYRSFRWRAFTPYRRFFLVILILNIVALVLICLGRTSTSRLSDIQTAVTVNIFSSIAFRNEHFVNNLFRLFIICTSKKAPLWWRRFCSKVYCFGGIHSGAGAAATVWFLLFTIFLIKEFTDKGELAITEVVALVLAICIWALLVAMIAFAMPQLRHRMHNSFEQVHRFAGWTVVALFWAETMVLGHINAKELDISLGQFLLRSVSFWLLILITLLVIYPWLQLRYVSVHVDKLSNHAVRIWFGRQHTHAPRALGCRTIRLATKPLQETHSFAVIPERESLEYSVIVSRAGDFTKSIIENPPKKIWIKGMPTWGVLRAATLFDPVVIVATGSGIGPCLGLFNDCDKLPCRVLWSARAPLKTYGQGIIDIVHRADPNAMIIDTDVSGHPDMIQSTYDLYKGSGAEAVVIISNPKLTYKLCQGLESRGVPAFGPIWDS